MISTKNRYIYPINKNDIASITYTKSPAHKGKLKYAVDFIIKEGTKIKAALSGIVIDVKQNSDKGGITKKYDKYGNYIELRHKHKEYSIYEHIKKNGSLVKIGDKVKQGQVIGHSGKTGWTALLGPHLHFDVHKYFGYGKNDYKTLKILWKK